MTTQQPHRSDADLALRSVAAELDALDALARRHGHAEVLLDEAQRELSDGTHPELVHADLHAAIIHLRAAAAALGRPTPQPATSCPRRRSAR